VFSWWLGKGSLLDFTNEEAKEWWHAQMDKVCSITDVTVHVEIKECDY